MIGKSKMKKLRLIARLDIKGPNLIKGIRMEGVRVLGDPQEFAHRYYSSGIDEIIYFDSVASLYGREKLVEIVQRTAARTFVPITVGGGLRTLEDVEAVLNSGADKVAINTAAVGRPEFLTEVAHRYGASCTVLSIEAKRRKAGGWEAYTSCGRDKTGLDVVEWARRGAELGAGEILLTSVDQDGTCRSFDIDLVREVTEAVPIPVIASGGMGSSGDLIRVMQEGKADAVAVASVLHYGKLSVGDIKDAAAKVGIEVRQS